MFILSYMHFQIRTPKPLEEVRALMESVTDPKRNWLTSPGFPSHVEDKDFIGKVGELDFKMVLRFRNLSRNSYEPVIEGQMRPEGSGTVVDVKIRQHWYLYGVDFIFWVIGIFFCLAAFVVLTTGNWESKDIVFGAFWMLSFLWGKCWFYFPAEKARQKLEDLLGAVSVDV